MKNDVNVLDDPRAYRGIAEVANDNIPDLGCAIGRMRDDVDHPHGVPVAVEPAGKVAALLIVSICTSSCRTALTMNP